MHYHRLKNYCSPKGMLSSLEYYFDGRKFCVQTVINMAIGIYIINRHCRKCAELVDCLNETFPSRKCRLWPIITPLDDENTHCETCIKKRNCQKL